MTTETVALDPEAPIKQFEQYLLAVIAYLGAGRATVVLDTSGWHGRRKLG